MTFIARFLYEERQLRTSIIDIPFDHEPTEHDLYTAEIEITRLLSEGGIATVFEHEGWEVGQGDWDDEGDELLFAEELEED